MVLTEASTEVRDEKGKILFSFHVMKYLLCLHVSPTDRYSGLKKKKQRLPGWVLDCDRILLARVIFIRDSAALHGTELTN